ncbi:hypothetical protein HZ326_22016 [Fusarium oxysporum f. sp. albedinis]|nr:hypothetical protein HZ326_22016 [Fusarium oxysporum f. sp. albedinis]
MCRYQKQTEYRFNFINYLCLCDVHCFAFQNFRIFLLINVAIDPRLSFHCSRLTFRSWFNTRWRPDIAIATTATKDAGSFLQQHSIGPTDAINKNLHKPSDIEIIIPR